MINLAHSTWEAEAYSKWEGKSVTELNRLAGRKKSYQVEDRPSILDDTQRMADPKILN